MQATRETTDPTDPLTLPFWLRRDLLDEAWNDKAIRKMLADGAWRRFRQGAYLDAVAWEGLDPAGRHLVTLRAAVAQARVPVVVSHTSAALLHGTPSWGLALDDVHLTRRDHRVGRRAAGICQHRGLLAPDDVVESAGLEVMSGTRTALELMTCTPVQPAVVAVSHLLRTGLTTKELLEERYRRPGSSFEQWPGGRTAELVLRLADGAFESIGEVRTFLLTWTHHLPAPTPQVEVRDAAGRLIARVDLAWPERGVFVEFDGRVKYEKFLRDSERAGDAVAREKRRERDICRATGWRCVRLTWWDLEHPEAFIAELCEALGVRRPRF